MSDELKLANWGNLQAYHTARNLDDMANDILLLKHQCLEQKGQLDKVSLKLGLLDHILHDTFEIQKAIAIASDKLERRVSILNEIADKTEQVKKKKYFVPDHVYIQATKGHHSKIKSLGQFSLILEEEKPEWDFRESDAIIEYVEEWISEFKSFKPILDPQHETALNMMAAESSNQMRIMVPREHYDEHMFDAEATATALPKVFNFGINNMNNLISQINRTTKILYIYYRLKALQQHKYRLQYGSPSDCEGRHHTLD